mgnify:CR=1 FL=1
MASDSPDGPSTSSSGTPPSFGDAGSFEDPDAAFDDGFDADGPSFGAPSGRSSSDRDAPFESASMMQEMAALYVREHQTASMLGAFAVGVFVGALLRN